jgi:hypothetical protein
MRATAVADGEPCTNPNCQQLQDELVGALETIRRQSAALGAARRAADPEKRAREHERWEVVSGLFDYWRRTCKHPSSRFSAKRFHQALPYVEAHGVEMCKRAIDGAAFDPYTTPRKNGTSKRFDDWSLVFRDDDKFEDFANRAPFKGETLADDAREAAARA